MSATEETPSPPATAVADEPPGGTRRPRRLHAPRPTIGAGAAAKAVAQDVSALVRAEVDLAKAELSQQVAAKAKGAGFLIGAGVLAWLAVQGLLIAAALGLALVLPGWAAALIVSAVLLLGAAGLGLAGRSKLATRVGLDATKHNVEEDVGWTKSHLPTR